MSGSLQLAASQTTHCIPRLWPASLKSHRTKGISQREEDVQSDSGLEGWAHPAVVSGPLQLLKAPRST